MYIRIGDEVRVTDDIKTPLLEPVDAGNWGRGIPDTQWGLKPKYRFDEFKPLRMTDALSNKYHQSLLFWE